MSYGCLTYLLSTYSTRYFDSQCEDEGWVLWEAGALEGGCKFELGILVRRKLTRWHESRNVGE